MGFTSIFSIYLVAIFGELISNIFLIKDKHRPRLRFTGLYLSDNMIVLWRFSEIIFVLLVSWTLEIFFISLFSNMIYFISAIIFTIGSTWVAIKFEAGLKFKLYDWVIWIVTLIITLSILYYFL